MVELLSNTLSISEEKGLKIAIHWLVKKHMINLIEGYGRLFSTTSLDYTAGRIIR